MKSIASDCSVNYCSNRKKTCSCIPNATTRRDSLLTCGIMWPFVAHSLTIHSPIWLTASSYHVTGTYYVCSYRRTVCCIVLPR